MSRKRRSTDELMDEVDEILHADDPEIPPSVSARLLCAMIIKVDRKHTDQIEDLRQDLIKIDRRAFGRRREDGNDGPSLDIRVEELERRAKSSPSLIALFRRDPRRTALLFFLVFGLMSTIWVSDIRHYLLELAGLPPETSAIIVPLIVAALAIGIGLMRPDERKGEK